MAFQKRHVIAHKLGVIDQDYVTKTGDTRAVVGRRSFVDDGEVKELVRIVKKLAPGMVAGFQKSNVRTAEQK